MPRDPRLDAFCSPASPDVFRSVVHRHELWREDPLDVQLIHRDARLAFEKQLDGATSPENRGAGRILLVKGISGSGKTHLMRAFRNSVHSREAGYFGYMQMSSSTKNYGAYVLSNLIESLDKPYDWTVDERSGLMRLSSALASATDDSGQLCISGDELQLIREEDMPAEELHDWLYDYTDRLLEVRRFGDIDGDLIRALLYLQRNDNRIKNRVLRYLRCEDLTVRDRKILGDIVPRIREEHPQWIIDQLGRLMWATDGTALVMCLDQFEDLYNLDQVDQKFRSAMSVVCDLAGGISSSVFVISVLADFYEQQKASLTRSIQDRLENDPTPITLTEGCKLDEIQALVGWRLRHFYDEAGASYDHDQPFYPYTDQELRQLRNMRTRDVLVWCQSRREELVAANGNDDGGVAVEVEQADQAGLLASFLSNDEKAGPVRITPPRPTALASATAVPQQSVRPVRQHNADTQRLESAWNDFRADCDISAPEAERSMHDLLQWAIKGASVELDSGHSFHAASDGDFIRVDISHGDEVLDRLMLKVCNGRVQGARLLKQLRELDAARGANRPVVLRSTEFPWNNTLKTTKQLAELIEDGGRRVVFEDSEWRSLIAFWHFTRTNRADENFDLWQSLEKPITQLYAIHATLDLDDLPTPTQSADVPVEIIPDPSPEPFVAPLNLPESEPELLVPEVGEIVVGLTVEEPRQPVSFPTTDLARHLGVVGHAKTGVDELVDGLVSQASRSGLRLVVIDHGGLTIGLPSLQKYYESSGAGGAPPVRVYVPGSQGEHACAIRLLPRRFLQLSATEQNNAVRVGARALGVLLGYNPRLGSAKSCIKILTQAVKVSGAQDGTAPVERLIKLIAGRDPGLVAALGSIKPTLLRDATNDLREVEAQLKALCLPSADPLDAADVFDLDILEEGQPAPITIVNTIKLPYPGQHAYVTYRLLADLERMLSSYESLPLGTLVCVLHADRVLPRTDETAVHSLFSKMLGKCRHGGVGLLMASESGGKFDLERLRGVHQWLTGPLRLPGMSEQALEIANKFDLPQPTGAEDHYLLMSEWSAIHLTTTTPEEDSARAEDVQTPSRVPWDLPAAPRRRLTQELPAFVPDKIETDEAAVTAESNSSPVEAEVASMEPVVAMEPVVIRPEIPARTPTTEPRAAEGPPGGKHACFRVEIPFPIGQEKSFNDAGSAVLEAHRNETTFKALTCKSAVEVGRAGAAQLFRLDVGAAVRYDRDWEGATAFKPKDSSRPDAALANPGTQSDWIGDVVEVDQGAGAMYVSAPDAQRLPKPGRFLVSPYQFLYRLHKVYHHEDFENLRALIRDRLQAVAGRNGLGLVSGPLQTAEGFEELWRHRWGVLWGPPGTGKTYTIGELVSAALRSEEERVLIVSTTNRATDEAAISTAEAVRRRYPGVPLQPMITRVGRGVGYEPFRKRSLMEIVSVAEDDLSRVHQARRRIQRAASAEERARLRKAYVDQLKALQDEAMTAFFNPDHRVVIATAHKTVDLVGENMLCTLLSKSETPFTTVIVDEASLISRSTAAVISLLAAQRVLFVGDPKQLAPISNLSRVLPTRQAYWLGCSALGHVEDANTQAPGVQLLRTQYRMHPMVRQVISNYQYGGVLRDAEEVTNRQKALRPLLGDAPRAIWYVLDEERPDDPAIRAERGPGNRSWVRKITPEVIERIVKAYPGLRDQTTLLLSPFSAQVKMLRDWIVDADLRDHWSAGTVHAQQGTEADVVIFDTVNAGSHGWSYDEWQRLINVGLSRARELVVFVASRYEMEEPFLKGLRSSLEPRVLVRQGSRWEWRKVERKLAPAADPQRDGDPALLGNQLRARAALRPIISAQQAQLSGLTMDGKPRLVRGVAGSGKTFVLANWVAKTAQKLIGAQQRRIWVIYANSTLGWMLQNNIKMALRQHPGLSAELRQNQIEIVHVYRVLSARLRQAGLRTKQNDYDYNEMARQYLERVPPERIEPSCDALFIDEAQDMGPETLRLLVALTRQSDPLDPSARSVNIMYDNAQNVYDRGTPRWTELGLDMRGRSTVMKESFRSTRPLNEFALNTLYRLSPPQGDPDHKELVSRELIVEERRGNRAWWRVNYNQIDGPVPELALHSRRDEELANLGRRIHELIVSENVRPSDIKVICMGKFYQQKIEYELSRRLKGFARVRVQKRQRFDEQNDMIVITTPHSFKGYDSEVVVVPMVDRFVFRDEKLFSQALYVAMTRARSYLIVTGTADRQTDLERELLTALKTTHADLQMKIVDEVEYEEIDDQEIGPEEVVDVIDRVDVAVDTPQPVHTEHQPVSSTDAEGHVVIEAVLSDGGLYFGYLPVDDEHHSLFPDGVNVVNLVLYDSDRTTTSWWSEHGEGWGIDNLKRWFGHHDLNVGDTVKIHVLDPRKLYRLEAPLN